MPVDPRYNALITKWATLVGSTQSKLDQINTLTITGSVPTTFYCTGDQILNAINWGEFASLTAQQQNNILGLCNTSGPLLGGSANTTHLVAGMILASFTTSGPTIAGLTALAKAQVQLWWQASVADGGGGLSSPVTSADLINAGGLT